MVVFHIKGRLVLDEVVMLLVELFDLIAECIKSIVSVTLDLIDCSLVFSNVIQIFEKLLILHLELLTFVEVLLFELFVLRQR